jgi:hypothetical protein
LGCSFAGVTALGLAAVVLAVSVAMVRCKKLTTIQALALSALGHGNSSIKSRRSTTMANFTTSTEV